MVDEGIFDNLRFGDEPRFSPRVALLDWGRKVGAFDNVGMFGAELAFSEPNMVG